MNLDYWLLSNLDIILFYRYIVELHSKLPEDS